MDAMKHSDSRKSDEIKKENDEDIIELTNVVEIKPQRSLDNNILPEDLTDPEDHILSDDLDMAEPDTDTVAEPATADFPEVPESPIESEPPENKEPAADEIDDLDADLGVLVSEITGASLGSGMTSASLPGMGEITLTQLDMAVERAVDKLFKEKIEAKIMALFEVVVKKEIEKIAELIQEEAEKN